MDFEGKMIMGFEIEYRNVIEILVRRLILDGREYWE